LFYIVGTIIVSSCVPENILDCPYDGSGISSSLTTISCNSPSSEYTALLAQSPIFIGSFTTSKFNYKGGVSDGLNAIKLSETGLYNVGIIKD